jgi:glycosyltransferase involved in cell wall biosynthesis
VLDALKAQSHKDFSVRIFDNASTDGSLRIIGEYKDSLDITVFKKSLNIGQNSNINRAFTNCSSEFVAILSGNDVVQDNYIEVLLGELLRHPEAASAYAKSIAVDENRQPLEKQPAWFDFFSITDPDPIKRACKSVERYCQASNFFSMYRKSAVDRAQAQPFRFGGDHVFAAEIALYGTVRFTDRTTVFRSPWPTSGKSNTRTEHLLRLFSKDEERGLLENSKLSNFELVTPTIDMFHGFLDMFRLADIPVEERPQLVSEGLHTLMSRMGERVEDEIEKLVGYIEFIEKGFSLDRFIDRVTLFHVLRKIDECILVTRDPRLFGVRYRLGELYLSLYTSEGGMQQKVAAQRS